MPMSSLVGRGSAFTVLVLSVVTLLGGCNDTLPTPDISSTPVPTPIVVSADPISPSPSATQAEPDSKDQLLEKARTLIEKARKDFPGHSSVVFIDLESDQPVMFSEEARFESASLMKLVVLAELYKQIQMGKRDGSDTLTLKARQQVGGSGSLKNAEPGTTYTLEILAEKMITESDNTATQMLTDLLGLKNLNQSARSLGMEKTTIERDIYDFAAIDRGRDNTITGKDAATFLKQMARDQLPGSPRMHEVLEKQSRNDMIGSGLPRGVRVAHKTGELNGILHDAGVVYAPRGAYVLVMLSDQVADKERATEIWSRLSQELYSLYSAPTPSPSASP